MVKNKLKKLNKIRYTKMSNKQIKIKARGQLQKPLRILQKNETPCDLEKFQRKLRFWCEMDGHLCKMSITNVDISHQ